MGDKLSIEEGAALLFAVFPRYPDTDPCKPVPSPDDWHSLPEKPRKEAAKDR